MANPNVSSIISIVKRCAHVCVELLALFYNVASSRQTAARKDHLKQGIAIPRKVKISRIQHLHPAAKVLENSSDKVQ